MADGERTPPGGELSVPELLTALKWKLGQKSSEEDILSYEGAIRHISCLLRSKSNSLKPVNALPSELLAHIFSHIQPRADFFPLLTQAEQHSLRLNEWIRTTTHVCSHWRQVALSTSTLWTHLFLPPSLQQETYGKRFLARAGPSVPLHVHLNLDSWIFDYRTRSVRPSPFLQKLKNDHSERLVELSINGAWHLRDSIWTLFSDCDAPNLECLSLDLSPWNFPSTDTAHVLTSIFRGGDIPSLRRLALKDVISWPSNRFDKLTHLWLGNQDRDFRLDMKSFLRDILEPCRETLEYLGLVDAGPHIPFAQALPEPDTKLDFPKLQTMEFGDFEFGSGTLLPYVLIAHMRIPKNCVVHVASDGMHGILEDHWPAEQPLDVNRIVTAPTTAVIRPAPKNTHTLTFHENVLHIGSFSPLLIVISNARQHLVNVTRLYVSTVLLAGASNTRVTEVWNMILDCAPKVKEVVFTHIPDAATSSGPSMAGFNWVRIIERIRSGGTNGGSGGLEHVYLPRMAPSTRLTAAERTTFKELEKEGESVIGSVTVKVGGVASQAPPNPFSALLSQRIP